MCGRRPIIIVIYQMCGGGGIYIEPSNCSYADASSAPRRRRVIRVDDTHTAGLRHRVPEPLAKNFPPEPAACDDDMPRVYFRAGVYRAELYIHIYRQRGS